MNANLFSGFPKALSALVMFFLIGLFGSQTAGAAGVCYVDASASGANSGASWADAYTDLQSALGASPCTEIWVAAGTYRPTADTDRAVSFTLKNGVALYGGFAGTETIRSQRDPAANVTTLSGDIGTSGDAADNSYHIVSGGGTDATAALDGFTITDGNANGSYPDNIGSGIVNINSSPTLTNLTLSGNSASDGGGGIYNDNSSPTLTNVTFSSDSASLRGGGLYNENGSHPTLADVTFNSNSAVYGGGMYNGSSSPVLTSVTFNGNTSYDAGGGMYNTYSNPTLTNVTFSRNMSTGTGGGMENKYSNPTLTNVAFSHNSASYGGGIDNYSSSPLLRNVTFSDNSADSGGGGMMNNGNSSPNLINVTFSGNSAYSGGGIYNGSGSSLTLKNVTFRSNSAHLGGGLYSYPAASSSQINNSIFWGNSAAVDGAEFYGNAYLNLADSVVAGGCPLSGATCANIITTDPLLGPLANNGGFTQTMALGVGSSAIDAGSDATCASTDQRGVPRPQGAHCDMGAYESIQIYLPLVIR